MNIIEDNTKELDHSITYQFDSVKSSSGRQPVESKSTGIYIDTESNTNTNRIS